MTNEFKTFYSLPQVFFVFLRNIELYFEFLTEKPQNINLQ